MARILMVDDDVFIIQLFKVVFERAGHKVRAVDSGDAALVAVEEELPDIMLLDVAMPGISGLDVLCALRASEKTRELPVIVFSNVYLGEMVENPLKDGPTRFIAKADCSAEDLLKAIHRLLEDAAPPAPVTAPVLTARMDPGAETSFLRRELTRGFTEAAPEVVNALRNQWHAFVRCDKEEMRGSLLESLARQAHALTSHASIAGLQTISQIASAFEALLIELTEDPQSINASTHRTMAHAVDCLVSLLESGATRPPGPQLAGVALAVDDEMTSLWAVCSALEMAQIRPIALDGPDIALAVLKHNRFDLIFLDVEMPGKTGYDVCKELRTYSTNKTTPVVFVTGLSDFSSRAKSTLSGGNDFIAKPFLLSELAVKTLIHIHKSREAAAKK